MRRFLAVAAALLVLSACSDIPTSGPVRQVPRTVPNAPDVAVAIDPRPPVAGESAEDVVQGFLDAMEATPINTAVARRFLTGKAANDWQPQRQTVTYDGSGPALDLGDGRVSVELADVSEFDARGSLRTHGGASRTITFALAKEGTEWRIAAAPAALIVPQSWFAARYTQVALYFLDPGGHVLVPEPVFVPGGPQLATALVTGLVRGVTDGKVERSYVPADATVNLSVPVSDGLARIDLTTSASPPDGAARERLIAQLAWTLRQDPTVQRFSVSYDGRVVGSAGHTTWSVGEGQADDPAAGSDDLGLYGVADGSLMQLAARSSRFAGVPGPWFSAHLTAAAVSLDGRRIAAVTGSTLVLGTLAGGGRPVLAGAAFLRPSWDLAGRVWIVDRAGGEARVYVRDDRLHELDVPGITGRAVTGVVVSRDGSRLAATVRTGSGVALVVSRIRSGVDGHVLNATAAETITRQSDIAAFGWRSPTTLLIAVPRASVTVIEALAVDGSGAGADPISVPGRVEQLVSSPDSSARIAAAVGSSLVDLGTLLPFASLGAGGQSRVTGVGYAG